MATFILVHGAFQGSFVWAQTAELLRRAGHEALTPGLTGLGERAHLLREGVSLSTYVDDVVNAVSFSRTGPALIAGHSFSGLVATAAAARLPGAVTGIAYVDALLPEDGQSFQSMAGPEFGKVLAAHVHDEWLVRPWPLNVFGVVEPELAPGFAARLTSTPLAAFTEPYRFGMPDPAVTRFFIRCIRNPNPLIAAQAAKARAAGFAWKEIDSNHAPMVTAPAALARALEECAAAAAPLGAPDADFFNHRLLRAAPARAAQLAENAP